VPASRPVTATRCGPRGPPYQRVKLSVHLGVATDVSGGQKLAELPDSVPPPGQEIVHCVVYKNLTMSSASAITIQSSAFFLILMT
jgi:hypothetical protein